MRVWKFEDDIDTDAIIPGRFLTIYDPEELARHIFEGTRNDFSREVRKGDIIVAGRNFGCGSSREHASIGLKGAGIEIVIAESFARIFYRNAINTGLLPVICLDADLIEDGSQITVSLADGFVEYGGKRLPIEPVPPFLQKIVNAGGLVEFARELEVVETCTGSHQ